jgi:hypothetical protein
MSGDAYVRVTVHVDPDTLLTVRHFPVPNEFVSLEVGGQLGLMVATAEVLDHLAGQVDEAWRLLSQPALPELGAA